MSVHIEMDRDRGTTIETAGKTDDVAAELTAAIGLIYAQLFQAEPSSAEEFREAVTAMTREDAEIWTAAKAEINGSYGTCAVCFPPESRMRHDAQSENERTDEHE